MSQTLAPQVEKETRGITWQKVMLGDWTRLVRDPLDVARIVFVAGTIAWGIAGRPVTVVLAASIVLIVARIVSMPRFYDFSLIIVMALVAWGEVLGFYDSWKSYDNVVHTSVPLLVTGLIYVMLIRLGVMQELSALTQPHQKFGLFLTTLALGMAVGAGWEVVEWTSDTTRGTHLVGSTTDTATDLIWDTLGAMGSAIILVLWSLGNHSMRRRPAAELANKPLLSFMSVRGRAV